MNEEELLELEAEAQAQAELEMEAETQAAPTLSPWLDRAGGEISLTKFGSDLAGSASDLSQLPKAASQVGSDIWANAADSPALALSTGFIAPTVETAAQYAKNYLSNNSLPEVASDAGMLMASLVPGGRTIAEAAQYLGREGELPKAEKVVGGVRKEVADYVVAGALSKLSGALMKAKRAAPRMLGGGVSSKYATYEKIVKPGASQTALGEEMASSIGALRQNTPSGIQRYDDVAAGFNVLARDPEAAILLNSIDNTPAGLDKLISGLDDIAHKPEIGVIAKKDELLKTLDTVATSENLSLPTGSKGKGLIGADELMAGEAKLNSIIEGTLNPEKRASIAQTKALYFDDLFNKSGTVQSYGIGSIINADGTRLGAIQLRIRQIDDALKDLHAYDLAQESKVTQGLVARPIGDEVALKNIRASLQEALEAQIKTMGGEEALANYQRYNQVYSAIRDAKPALEFFRTAANAVDQPTAQIGLRADTSGIKGAIATTAQNLAGQEQATVLNKIRAIERMQRAMRFASGEQSLGLIPRTFEALAQSQEAVQEVAFLAMQAGVIFDSNEFLQASPGKQRDIHAAVAQVFPGSFQRPKSGFASEINGELLDPADQDYYTALKYKDLRDDPSKRADILGPFLSHKKVVDESTIGALEQQAMPAFSPIELYPQADGGFGLPSTLKMGEQGLSAELLSFAESMKAIGEGY